MRKFLITTFLISISIFLIFPILIMFWVNLGLTNEKSGVWNHINLRWSNDEITELQKNNIRIKEIISTWIIIDINPEKKKKMEFCKKEVLLAIDNSLGLILYTDTIFSNVKSLVWDITWPLLYCLISNTNWNYSFSTLREKVILSVDPKFVNNIVSDVYNYERYEYVRNFFIDPIKKDYFDRVVTQLKDVTEDELKSVIMIEQIRSTMTNRWFFKEMVKNNILQSYTQFSLWISWMKLGTAKNIENYLKDSNSEFYLWKEYENILDYDLGKKMSLEKRLTENENYYYQYLYTWLAIKMIKKQWKDKWYDLTGKIWLIATIYNIWFKNSVPKPFPSIWWAVIYIDWKKWYFWELWEKIWISLQRYK